MNYLEDINNWIEDFVKTVCGRDEISTDEAERLKDLYVNLRSSYKKETIDQITTDGLKANLGVVDYFKSKEIAQAEIDDLFNFYQETAKLVNSKEFKETLSDSMELNDASKIKDYKSQKIQETGILSFVEFKNYFKHDVAFCEVKEALGWCMAYVESGDYNITDIIVKNESGTVDKEKTFEKILEDINKKALTNVPPFQMENGKVKFIAAGSSEIDVKLWNESEQKIIGMSATRDRTNIIEGNQFIRHNMQINAWAAIYAKYKKQNRLPQEYKLSPAEVKKINHDFGEQNRLKDKSILRIRGLSDDVKNVIEKHHMEFARHLSFVREFLFDKTGHSFHENGLTITPAEIKLMTETFEPMSKFYYFGETLAKAQVPEIHAGLNKRSYLGNFENIMDFKMGHEAAKIFLDSLEVRFNNVKADAKIDKFAEFVMYNLLIKDSVDFAKIADVFSEGSVYKEERGTLFKSISLFLQDINKITSLSDNAIDTTVQLHFPTLNDSQKLEIKEKLVSGELFKTLDHNYKAIGKAPSEVNQFADVMISYATACENKLQLLSEKQKNDTMIDFLRSQGITVDMDALARFAQQQKEQKNDNKENLSGNNFKFN
jgi:hypothetical protein